MLEIASRQGSQKNLPLVQLPEYDNLKREKVMFILEHHRVSVTRHALNGKKKHLIFVFSTPNRHKAARKRISKYRSFCSVVNK